MARARRQRIGIAAMAAAAALASGPTGGSRGDGPPPAIEPPAWVKRATRMGYLAPGQLDEAERAGVQVVHTNLVWPYYPLRRDGGGLADGDARALRALADDCHRRGMKLSLGLPPFPPVALVKAHPDWRVHPDDAGSVLGVEPREDNLGTRIGCNVGPWGDYLLDVLDELLVDYKIDAYSFDGNYQPALCYCPACKAAYRRDTGGDLPPRVDLDSVDYRKYLVWRGEKLEDHYRRMQARLKTLDPDAAVLTWTVNAGRYGHLLTSPRAMPARMNRLIDLPMQEWWLDETNLGGSIAPSFGLAYLRGLMGGDRPCASEPYLMSRGNPYGSDSFPKHERLVRSLMAMTYGNLAPQSLGWPGHGPTTRDVFAELAPRERWTRDIRPLPWAALLVSEPTRQFVAYKDIAGRYLPHLFGAFRAATEEHRPVDLIADEDVTPGRLGRYRVLLLPESAALSDAQVEAIRAYVRDGGGLVATCGTSLADELGRPRPDFALADLFGVSYRGRPDESAARPELDANFAIALGDDYWKQRVGVARLSWADHDLARDDRLADLVPDRRAIFRGPRLVVSEPADPAEVVARAVTEGTTGPPVPALIARAFGKGRVVYSAAGIDAALWSYAYPYQRRLLDRALVWAARAEPAAQVRAPMAVQATYWEQADGDGRRVVVQLFNGVDTTARHGLPAMEVPLREETIPIHGIQVRLRGEFARVHVEPGGLEPPVRRDADGIVVDLPPLAIHALLVGERPGDR